MYCPHCGQQQTSHETRFCPRCGMPLAGVAQLLANNGSLDGLTAVTPSDIPPRQLSPRQKGLRRAAILFFVGLVLTPILGIISAELGALEVLVALCAVICFLGALVRMLYALLFEDRYPPHSPLIANETAPAAHRPAHFVPAPGENAPAYLPPAQTSSQVLSAADVRRRQQQQQQQQPRGRPLRPQPAAPRRDTDELLSSPPPSVTENTTRLLAVPDAEGATPTKTERGKN